MNHRQLQYFVEVYKEKSISSAARKLYISPQGVSRAIHDLESDLNHMVLCQYLPPLGAGQKEPPP
jgi:DNA-binding transcriptional LysR family regulator